MINCRARHRHQHEACLHAHAHEPNTTNTRKIREIALQSLAAELSSCQLAKSNNKQHGHEANEASPS